MCLTLPGKTLITVMGIEKVVPALAWTWTCSCKLLPRSVDRGSG